MLRALKIMASWVVPSALLPAGRRRGWTHAAMQPLRKLNFYPRNQVQAGTFVLRATPYEEKGNAPWHPKKYSPRSAQVLWWLHSRFLSEPALPRLHLMDTAPPLIMSTRPMVRIGFTTTQGPSDVPTGGYPARRIVTAFLNDRRPTYRCARGEESRRSVLVVGILFAPVKSRILCRSVKNEGAPVRLDCSLKTRAR
jgi:hypothetical protein